MASTVLWRNLALVPETDTEAPGEGSTEEAEVSEGGAQTIFVYMRRGAVIEVHPATAVRLTDECVEVVNEKQVVAAYPRERVILATTHLIGQLPFC